MYSLLWLCGMKQCCSYVHLIEIVQISNEFIIELVCGWVFKGL